MGNSWLDNLKTKSARRRIRMELDLDLPYVVDDADRQNPGFKTNAAISISLLRTAMNAVKSGQKEGHKNRTEVRIAAQVVNAITRVNNAKGTKLDLDQNQMLHVRDMMKQWMTDTGVPAPLVGWYEDLMTAVEKTVEDGDKAVESAKKNGTEKSMEKAAAKA
jgi:hypothetical protein